MENDSVIAFACPDQIDDPLTDVLRRGARRLLAQAIEAEVEAFIDEHAEFRTDDGRRRIVRHGHGPERVIQTGIGPVGVRRAKARDRGAGEGKERIRFTSAILPRWARRSPRLDALLPTLYLRGISTGDFQECLAALLGPDAANLSPAALRRLKASWKEELDKWQKRTLEARRYVYVWADGIYLQARMEQEKQCILVIIGATPEGRSKRRRRSEATTGTGNELVGFQIGYRESAQSWRELLLDLKKRGLCIPPELAVGDGALGFWKAIEEAFPTTRHQRCWVHKTANVLNKLPKSVQKNAKADLAEVWAAECRADAEAAMEHFAEKYSPKYDRAVTCLVKDREALLTFFDFPAEHWQHLRTTNPIESVFATVRHRTVRSKGCLSFKTALVMVFKLVMAASKTWRRLKGRNQLPKVIEGVTFKDGLEAKRETEVAA